MDAVSMGRFRPPGLFPQFSSSRVTMIVTRLIFSRFGMKSPKNWTSRGHRTYRTFEIFFLYFATPALSCHWEILLVLRILRKPRVPWWVLGSGKLIRACENQLSKNLNINSDEECNLWAFDIGFRTIMLGAISYYALALKPHTFLYCSYFWIFSQARLKFLVIHRFSYLEISVTFVYFVHGTSEN